MVFTDNGEVVKQNFLRTMNDEEIFAMVDRQDSPTQLPFVNLAWQNRKRSIRQMCFACLNAIKTTGPIM